MGRNRCLLYDLDGTLVDSRWDLADAVNYMRESFSLEPLPRETIITYVGNGAKNLILRALADAESIDKTEAVARFKAHYSAHLVDQTTLYPGVKEGLTKLKEAGFVQAITTNKPLPATKEITEKLGISEYFDKLIGDDGRTPLKPDPSSLLQFLTQSRAALSGSWILGDNYTDLEAGRRAGILRAYASYGFGNPKTENWNAKIDNFSEFVEQRLAELEE